MHENYLIFNFQNIFFFFFFFIESIIKIKTKNKIYINLIKIARIRFIIPLIE